MVDSFGHSLALRLCLFELQKATLHPRPLDVFAILPRTRGDTVRPCALSLSFGGSLEADAQQLPIHVSEHLDQIKLLWVVIKVYLMALHEARDLREPFWNRVYEVTVVGLSTQRVLGVENIAQPPIHLCQIVFAKESSRLSTRFGSRDPASRSTALG